MMKLFSNVFMLMNILIALLFSSVFLNHNWMVYAGGDGDGERYAGPINQGDSREKIIYCTFNQEVKAPLCEGTSRSDIIIGTLQEDFIEGKGSDDALQGR
ncbi:MAG: hypothetical protein DA329_12425, partial [Candidatus Nitrosocosmicus sp.]|nr:hypothetical protein [Candidatus Nitrosocosmicus sp.]